VKSFASDNPLHTPLYQTVHRNTVKNLAVGGQTRLPSVGDWCKDATNASQMSQIKKL